ncbi:hypothetical protein [Streptomyces sp. CRN 30]|uniref:hypothetical protein n=1 Tax=Streptomyces sp. CRN 30 TaxID=3075613 RepID=UPI002A80D750|nr:hypothetical protein [Streptomyces sp. CRN 30]
MHPFALAARTAHTPVVGEIALGIVLMCLGGFAASNFRGWSESTSDYIGSRYVSALYGNGSLLRIVAGFFCVIGIVLIVMNARLHFMDF